MKSIIILCLYGLAAVAYARSGQQYTDRYDSVNLKEILSNRRLFLPYVKCLLDQGRCTPDGRELKSHIREALEEDCAKCTQAQRDGTRLVLGHVINNEAEYWNQLKAKYDRSGKYSAKYERDLRILKA